MKQYWARVDGRSQAGGWLFFTGKAAASSMDKAYFKAEGLALSRLVQECRLIHRKVRIIERCDEKVGTSFLAYVRANVTVDECQKTQKDSNRKIINDKFTKIYKEYDKEQRKERLINQQGGNSKLSNLRDNLNNLLTKIRTTNVQKEIERKQKELHLLESKVQKKSRRCSDAIDCLIKGNNYLKSGNTFKANWAYYDGCYTYKDPELCFAYGTYIKSNGQKRTKKQSVYKAFKEACSRNHGEACFELGNWERYRFKNKKIDAKLSYKLSCNLNFYKGCAARGKIDWSKYKTTGEKKYLDSAEKYFIKSCITLEQPQGCLYSYNRTRFNRYRPNKKKVKLDVKRQNKIQLDLVKYACDKKSHLPSCHAVFTAMKAVKYNWNKKTKKNDMTYNPNFKKAVNYYKVNCNNGYGKSCGSYAYYLREYFKKEAESNKLYEKTCKEHKQSFFCSAYSKHLVSKKNFKKAIEYSELACNLNNIGGCLDWGTILEDNLNKYDEAASIYKIACEKNNKTACGRYGLYIAEVLNKPASGLNFTKKGCYYKTLDPKKNTIHYNSQEACVYRAKIEVQKYKKIAQYKKVLKGQCAQTRLRKKAKDMACELYEEISN